MAGVRNAVIVVGVLAVLAIVGCGGGGDGGGGGSIDAGLVGIWQAYAGRIDGVEVGARNAMDWDQEVVRFTVQFANDGTVTVREYNAEDTVVGTENGTWTALGGNLTVTMPDETVILTYQRNGNLLVTTQTEGGSQVVIHWVKVVNLAAHDAQLVGSWRVVSVETNGTAVPVMDYFETGEPADTVVFQLLGDGGFRGFWLSDSEIVELMEGSWATGNGAIAITDGEGHVMRGSFVANNTSVTLLDPDGDTLKMELTPWAPAATRDSALVGSWQLQSVTVNGNVVDPGQFFEWEPNTVSMSVYFYADGTFIPLELDQSGEPTAGEMGTWSTAGNNLTLNLGEVIVATYTVVGNTATLSVQEDGDQVVITFTRTS